MASDLSTATTDELIKELGSRASQVVVLLQRDQKIGTDPEYRMLWTGTLTGTLGLLYYGKIRAERLVWKAEMAREGGS